LRPDCRQSGSDPGFAFQTGPVQTILKSRLHLRTGLLQSHPRSEAFQGDTVCLRVSNICLHILPLPSTARFDFPNRCTRKDLLACWKRTFALCRRAFGRTIAPYLTAQKRSSAHIGCARPRSVRRTMLSRWRSAWPAKERESLGQPHTGKTFHQFCTSAHYATC
jgi:hypothetical protein